MNSLLTIIWTLCITETWQKTQKYFSQNQTTPPGYAYIDKPRLRGPGGGIAIFFRQSITSSTMSIPAPPNLNILFFKLSGPKPLVAAVIYRPPPNLTQLSYLTCRNSVPSLHPFCYSVTLTYMSTPLQNLRRTSGHHKHLQLHPTC